MTRNLKILVLFSVAWSVAFFGVLHWSLLDTEQRWPVTLVAAVTYGLGFALAGCWLGRRDPQRNVRYALEPRYSLTTSVVSLVIGGLWILLFRPEGLLGLVLIALGVGIQAYFSLRPNRQAIKGYPTEKLFK